MFFSSSVSINILLLSSADNNRSIYRDELKKIHYKLPWKGTIPWEKGFLWGRITLVNGAWQSFGVVKCLKLRYF